MAGVVAGRIIGNLPEWLEKERERIVSGIEKVG
jgi:hypothetical protein